MSGDGSNMSNEEMMRQLRGMRAEFMQTVVALKDEVVAVEEKVVALKYEVVAVEEKVVALGVSTSNLEGKTLMLEDKVAALGVQLQANSEITVDHRVWLVAAAVFLARFVCPDKKHHHSSVVAIKRALDKAQNNPGQRRFAPPQLSTFLETEVVEPEQLMARQPSPEKVLKQLRSLTTFFRASAKDETTEQLCLHTAQAVEEALNSPTT